MKMRGLTLKATVNSLGRQNLLWVIIYNLRVNLRIWGVQWRSCYIQLKYEAIIFVQSVARFHVLWFRFETQRLKKLLIWYFRSVSNVPNNGKSVPKGLGRVTTNSNQLIYQMIWAKSPWSGNDRISKADFQDAQSEGSHHTLIFDSNSKWTPFLLTPRE